MNIFSPEYHDFIHANWFIFQWRTVLLDLSSILFLWSGHANFHLPYAKSRSGTLNGMSQFVRQLSADTKKFDLTDLT